jgi:riboflavin kinase / FMN adenylyltransferase
MKVHNDLQSLPTFKNAVITIGTFDGVHYGHRKIIQQLVDTAKKVEGESVLITFEPHPRMVINPTDTSLKLLSTLQEKTAVLSELGINHFVIAPFTNAFMNMPAEDYIKNFLVKYFSPHTIIIGYDHQFGNKRLGNFALLQQFSQSLNYNLVEIEKQLITELTVSSTTIRKALLAGNLVIANNLLLQNYTISGTVVHGDKRGRTIGYPTANIAIHNKYKLIPSNGVYAIKANFMGTTYGGMMNIGVRPTVHADGQQSIEAHLFNFNKTIYDEYISIQLVQKIRDEKKFENLEDLIAAIKLDEIMCKKILDI